MRVTVPASALFFQLATSAAWLKCFEHYITDNNPAIGPANMAKRVFV